MNDDEYKAMLDLLCGQARMISQLPVDEAIADLGRVESVGFLFVAPMEYQRGLHNIEDARELLVAFRGVRDAMVNIGKRAFQRSVVDDAQPPEPDSLTVDGDPRCTLSNDVVECERDRGHPGLCAVFFDGD